MQGWILILLFQAHVYGGEAGQISQQSGFTEHACSIALQKAQQMNEHVKGVCVSVGVNGD